MFGQKFDYSLKLRDAEFLENWLMLSILNSEQLKAKLIIFFWECTYLK